MLRAHWQVHCGYLETDMLERCHPDPTGTASPLGNWPRPIPAPGYFHSAMVTGISGAKPFLDCSQGQVRIHLEKREEFSKGGPMSSIWIMRETALRGAGQGGGRSWLEHCPVHQKGRRFDSPSRHIPRTYLHDRFEPQFSFLLMFFSLCVKSMNISRGEY